MKKLIQILLIILLFILLVGLVILRIQQGPAPEASEISSDPTSVTRSKANSAGVSAVPSSAGNADSGIQVPVVSAPEPIAATPEPTPTPTPEPTPEFFTISVIGDETLTSHQMLSDQSEYSYAGRMNGDYSYPFKNTVQYFSDDEFTISN